MAEQWLIDVVAVNGGLGDPSSTRLLVDRLANAVETLSAGQVRLRVIDLRDIAVDIAQSMIAGFPVGDAREAIAAVQQADGVIAATPVFNASYSGLFKSFFDLVDVERFSGKPVLIAATGGSPRHSMVLDHALRPMFAYLRSVVVPTGVYAAAEDWAGGAGDTANLGDRVKRAAGEFVNLLASGNAAPAVIGAGVGADEPSAATRDAAEAEGIANFARLLGHS